MKFGFVIPYASAREAADLAHEAEAAGWDGIFVWEPIWGIDAWVSMTAMAMRTTRIRLGTLLSPLARMRPWDVASKAVALDHLSGGRLTLTVGLGAIDTGYAAFGEVTHRRTRAELLDESLDIIWGLWRGQPFEYRGKHYTIRPTEFMVPPAPLQQPRIPIWCVGMHGSTKSMARAMRCDGLVPSSRDTAGNPQQALPDQLRQMTEYVRQHRAIQGYDIIVEGKTPSADRARAHDLIVPYADAGATWWIEAMWDAIEHPDLVRERLRAGPPA